MTFTYISYPVNCFTQTRIPILNSESTEDAQVNGPIPGSRTAAGEQLWYVPGRVGSTAADTSIKCRVLRSIWACWATSIQGPSLLLGSARIILARRTFQFCYCYFILERPMETKLIFDHLNFVSNIFSHSLVRIFWRFRSSLHIPFCFKI